MDTDNKRHELTDQQRAEIAKTLIRHGIGVADTQKIACGGRRVAPFDWLCMRIEINWWELDSFREREGDGRRFCGRAEMLGQIERLRYALSGLSGGTVCALSQCSWATETQGRLDKIQAQQLWEPLCEALSDSDCDAPDSIFSLGFDLLREACEIALSTGGPPLSSSATTAIDECATKPGRPRDYPMVDFVRGLMHDFRVATRRQPTDTPSGPFDDFLITVLQIIQGRAPNTCRKMIRRAKGKKTT
ncbi:hypothetical protein ACFLSJ_04595 [Verrucomicrobiota bacterium]